MISRNEKLAESEEIFLCNLAKQFPNEIHLLSKDVQYSPGITHDLAKDFNQQELPSAILCKNELLPFAEHHYDRTQYVELNRGLASALCLRRVLLGGDKNYEAFTRGQNQFIKLTRAQFDNLHEEYNTKLHTDELIEAAIYMTAFNDVGKSNLLIDFAAKQMSKTVDHDEVNAYIVQNEELRAKFLPGLHALNKPVRDLICHAVGLDFNPSCFTQGEYPLDPVAKIATALQSVPDGIKLDVFNLIKIESAMDVAGVKGHQAPGGAAYIKFVHPAFDLAFNKLTDLLTGKSPKDVYLSHLNEYSQKFGLNELKDTNEEIAYTRTALMIRSSNKEDGTLIINAYQKLKNQSSKLYKVLIDELAIDNLDNNKTTLWMQYSPDLLRILSKENKGKMSKVDGLALGLKIFSNALAKARHDLTLNSSCHMLQAREIIPTVRQAALGNKDALENLNKAAKGDLNITSNTVTLGKPLPSLERQPTPDSVVASKSLFAKPKKLEPGSVHPVRSRTLNGI